MTPLRPSRHEEPSTLYAVDDDVQANDFLFNLAVNAIQVAKSELIEVPKNSEKIHDFVWFNVFPGEHYRILRAFSKILNATCITELGTYTGMGTASFLQANNNSVIHTFDILPWDSGASHISKENLNSGRVKYHVADLADPAVFSQYKSILNQSDIIFSDGPKDGVFENKFLNLLTTLDPKPNKLLILDDTKILRNANMVETWRRIQSPKMDITSFGHWSGTGIVDISQPLRFIF